MKGENKKVWAALFLMVTLHSGQNHSSVSTILSRWNSSSTIGEFDGHLKRVQSCDFKPTRPFHIVICGEDILANFYEGPPFKFKHSISYVFGPVAKSSQMRSMRA